MYRHFEEPGLYKDVNPSNNASSRCVSSSHCVEVNAYDRSEVEKDE